MNSNRPSDLNYRSEKPNPGQDSGSRRQAWGSLLRSERSSPNFFAGHGTYDETRFKDGMLVCTGSKKDDKFYRSYINFEILKQLVDILPCRHILLLLDVCFGGTFDQRVRRGVEQSRGPALEPEDALRLSRAVQWPSRWVLTSGGKESVSDGPPGEHSPFAGKLLEIFRTEGMRRPFLSFEDLLGPIQHLRSQPIYQQFGIHQPGVHSFSSADLRTGSPIQTVKSVRFAAFFLIGSPVQR